jgi:hypothetical protein
MEEVIQEASAPPPGKPPLEAAVAPAPQGVAPEPEGVASEPEAAGQPFVWPPSTRLSYALTGYYRGPVDGSAQVEWLLDGTRYQVHLDVIVGPGFAPLMTRRMSSEGEISALGLQPQRYEEQTRVFLSRRERSMRFAPDAVVLADGARAPTLPGVQDTASQFVQLTWLFATQPQRLREGASVEVPLALPHRVGRWIYDVVAQERLDAPFGALPAWYLRPRPGIQGPRDLAVEIWIAPTLQYLPVRLRIRQDAETFVDLMLSRLPQQAAASSAPQAPAPARPSNPDPDPFRSSP